MSQLKSLASQTVVYGLGHVLPRALYFVFLVPYLTRRLEDTLSFGIYTDLYAYSTILIVFFSFRMDTALFRFGSKTGSLQQAFSTTLLPVLIFAITMVTLGVLNRDWIADLLAYPDKGFYITWFAIIIGLDVIMLLPFARLRLEQRALAFSLFKILNVGLTIGLVLLFLETNLLASYALGFDDVEFVFLANLIASSLLCIAMLPILLKARLRDVDRPLLRKMLTYSAPLVIVGAANSINQFFGVPIQKFFLGGNTVENLSDGGLYSASQKIAALVSLVTVAFNYAAEPFFFRHAANSDDRSVYGNIALGFCLFMGLVVLGIMGYFEILKHLADVTKYESGYVVVPILLLAYFLLGLYYNVSIWYKLADMTRYGAYISIVGAVITLAISIVLLPLIGIIASAWAALVCYGVMCILAYIYGQRYYQITYPLASIFTIFCLVVGGVILINQVNSLDLTVISKLAINSFLILGYLSIVWVKYGGFLKTHFRG